MLRNETRSGQKYKHDRFYKYHGTNPQTAWINMHNSLSAKRDYKASGGL